MNITADISAVVKNTAEQAKKELMIIVVSDAPLVIEAINTYIANLENRTASLLNYIINNPTDVRFVIDRVREEPDILKTEVFSFLIIGKGIVQNVVNNIQDLILSAVYAILPSQINSTPNT